MPTYEYCCENKNCNHTWENESKITEDPLKTCPHCNKETAKRLVSGGQGFQLQGSGWFNSGGY
jgi:putative FmdB family regulatory protein